MKKMIIFFLSAAFLILLGACSSPEAKEVLEFHNDYVDYVNPKMEEIAESEEKMETAETDEEESEIVHDEIVPVMDDIRGYFDEQEPEEDLTKEYHELRSAWADNYYDGLQMQDEAYEVLLDGSDEEAFDLFEEAEEQVTEANEYAKEADEKWDDIMDEYDFEEEEEG